MARLLPGLGRIVGAPMALALNFEKRHEPQETTGCRVLVAISLRHPCKPRYSGRVLDRSWPISVGLGENATDNLGTRRLKINFVVISQMGHLGADDGRVLVAFGKMAGLSYLLSIYISLCFFVVAFFFLFGRHFGWVSKGLVLFWEGGVQERVI